MKIRFVAGDFEMTATLNDSKAAAALAENLPIEGLVQTMGAEVYFFVDFPVEEENPVEEAPPGSVALWHPGSALCVFFGARPVSPVTIVGMLDGDPSKWRDVVSGSPIMIEKA